MRLKSYFAPSVQAAIAMARREFGDEITLVTSHVAPVDARQLGEYEVVFDIEEELRPATTAAVAPVTPPIVAAMMPEEKASQAALLSVAPLPGVPSFTAFQETLLEAVAPKAAAEDEKAQKLRQIRFALIELGIEAGLTRAIMSMLEGSIGKRTARASNQTASVIAPTAAVTPIAQEPFVTCAGTIAESVVAAATPAVTGVPVAAAIAAPQMTAEVVPFELSAQEQAAEQSGKVVVISKRRELLSAFANNERPTVTPTLSPATPTLAAVSPAANGPTAAERAFMSSLSETTPMERRAVGC